MKEGKTYLIEVAPIGKASQGTLSYFSAVRLEPGTFVRVPLRKSLVTAAVLGSKDAKTAKSDIRRAGFVLKKISKRDVLGAALSPDILRAAGEAAQYYASDTGSLLSALIPKAMLESAADFFPEERVRRRARADRHIETLLLQMETEERLGQYRALVRQSFARGASVMLVVPTHLEIGRIRRELEKGIAEFVHVFALGSSKKAMAKVWSRALEEKHPILFITTPAGSLFPRRDIDTIIIERENSRAYRTLARPFIHYKRVLEMLARETDRQLVLGDSVLSLESLWREKRGEFGENSLIRWRLPAAPATLIDATSKQNEAGRFEIFSPELRELVEKAVAENGRVLLFAARKGLYPTTVCGDCGAVLPCKNCGAPVVLHRRDEANVYICHACSARRESTTVCGYCGSWKLVPLGIGIEEVAREAKKLCPKAPIHILDKDHAPSDAKASSIAQEFEKEGGILVATELAFFHVEEADVSAVVSLDALFSIPDFGINERIFYLISRLREMTKSSALIQTRRYSAGKSILGWAAQGSVSDFYQSEIAEREALSYPPFSAFIKIEALTRDAERELPLMRERLMRWQPDVLKNSLIMRLRREAWPDKELLRELALLSPQFSIKVEPESIL